MNIADVNAKVLIAFALTLIAGALIYVAFFKGSSSKSSK
jgi:hypothetical protein